MVLYIFNFVTEVNTGYLTCPNIVFFMYVSNMTATLPDKSAIMEETDQELNR